MTTEEWNEIFPEINNIKNLHIIQTDKPSRLFYHVGGTLLFTNYEHYNGVNIYITSDEEIKDDEWHLHYYEGKPVISKSHNGASEYINSKAKEFGYKKIILTTDQELIKDGVQAIDNEFLEWFVKNPSCKEVEIKETYPLNCCINKEGKTKMNKGCMERNRCLDYKIIIPKEEPKDVVLGYKTSLDAQMLDKIEPKQECKDCNKSLEDCTCIEDTIDMKQETLEEVAERLYSAEWDWKEKESFIEGAEWQAERMYSDEEAGKLVYNVMGEYAKRENIFFKSDLINNLFNNLKRNKIMTSERIKEIQQETAFPDSVSVCQSLLKVWNECEQDNKDKKYTEEDLKQFAFECVAYFLSNNDNKVEIKLVDVIIDRVNDKFEQFKKK